jgi:phenylacetate-CoA ligase
MLDTFFESQYLASALRRQYWSRKKLRKYQEKKLRSIVNYAYNHVTFYHYKFKREGIKPTDIKTIKDLSKIQIITKDDLKKEKPTQLLSTRSSTKGLRIQYTSGSTGKPFAIYLNNKEECWRKAISLRANIICGQKIRDKWILIRAPHHFSDSSPVQKKLNILSPINLLVLRNFDYQINLLQKASPDIIDGYSGTLFLLAKEIENKDLTGINPRIIFGTAELINDKSSNFIEKIFDAPYYDQFGCSEFDRTAWECPEKVGYHMDVDSVITQFVDKEGKDVSSGEKGEIVYTSLFNYAMPFIRYAIGDLGVPSDETCSCGRSFPIMKIIEGRKDSFLVLPGRKKLSPRVLTNALSSFGYYSSINQFRVIQEKENLINILIEKQEDAIQDNFFKEALKTHFAREFKFLFKNIKFEIKMQKILPEKTGKRRTVISKLS